MRRKGGKCRRKAEKKSELNGLVDFNIAAAVGNLAVNPGATTPKDQVRAGVPDPEIINPKFVERNRQAGVGQTYLWLLCQNGYAQAGAEHQKDRSGGPSLRCAGDWIQGGPASVVSFMEAAKQFRHSLEFEVAAGLVQTV